MRNLTVREIVEPIVREIVAETTARPLFVTQLNCLAVLGISRRAHLENCRHPDFTPRVIKQGKLRMVDAAAYRSWLELRSDSSAHLEPAQSVDAADQLLHELGFHMTTKKAG